jgi:presenilin-like A22 family membrane protease
MDKSEKRAMRDFFPFLLMASLFVVVDGLALLLTRPFEAAGVEVFVNPDDPLNLLIFFVTMLVFTVIILLIARFGKDRLVQGIVLGSTALLAFYVLYPLLILVLPDVWSLGLSLVSAAILVILLIKYPEWYVLDLCGILVGVGSVAMLGISLNILLVIILLAALAIYDAIAVYKTKHMIDIADTIITLKLPIVFVMPRIRKYSLIKETKSLKEKLREGEAREAFFMGLGDIVMPGILVVSTFYNLPNNGLLVALSVIAGTLIGFAALMTLVFKGKPQAGLPFLCSGAILGYVVSSYLLFGELVGMTLPI